MSLFLFSIFKKFYSLISDCYPNDHSQSLSEIPGGLEKSDNCFYLKVTKTANQINEKIDYNIINNQETLIKKEALLACDSIVSNEDNKIISTKLKNGNIINDKNSLFDSDKNKIFKESTNHKIRNKSHFGQIRGVNGLNKSKKFARILKSFNTCKDLKSIEYEKNFANELRLYKEGMS